ncbi:rhodanese-like domain-containing protein [Paenibacillus harenae]|uniref:rhodanese-like domain-containing protein n=1 Tax=Paenibacillus harenae TaxID=306543 RepID=UPI00040C1642|nr:rhodanese-like domain-containing protein [Paenibacillus harenae]
MANWQNVTPQAMLELLESGQVKPEQLIDVREPYEWDYYHIDQSKLIPMNTIPLIISELMQEQPIYVICAHGVRSVAVCSYLEEQGCSGIHNVTGGMAAIASLKGFRYD